MTVFDVTQDQDQGQVTKLAWCNNSRFNLVRATAVDGGICIMQPLLRSLSESDQPYIATRENAENYIKALQKALDLGWLPR